MNTASTPSPIRGESALAGQTVVVIGGSAGIGLETARLARAEGAKLILAARTPEPLQRAASEVGALSSAAFDATDFERLAKFFDELPTPIDDVLITGPGPYYAPLVSRCTGYVEFRAEHDFLHWNRGHLLGRCTGIVG